MAVSSRLASSRLASQKPLLPVPAGDDVDLVRKPVGQHSLAAELLAHIPSATVRGPARARTMSTGEEPSVVSRSTA